MVQAVYTSNKGKEIFINIRTIDKNEQTFHELTIDEAKKLRASLFQAIKQAKVLIPIYNTAMQP